ncbi:hypothetical protein LCGC14_1001420 [marine sediment metagenome]|uniref:Uncharacterized protein n=1 Tax=marine sediment metagenome TaxID=412755 RepID=A0A0F9N7P0_9ZZZZ
MKIWNLKSAMIIWVFAWGWFQAFDSCAPDRERWSGVQEHAQVTADEKATRQAESEARDAAKFAKMCADPMNRMAEICNPPKEHWFFTSWFADDRLSEAQEIAASID